MQPEAIETDAGSLELTKANVDQIRGIAHYWPFPLTAECSEPEQWDLVFQIGEQEIQGVKMQPVDTGKREALIANHVYRAAIAAGLPFYIEKGHRGLMLPCSYLRDKGPESAESGIVFFVGPDPESGGQKEEKAALGWDERLGRGATNMIYDMLSALACGLAACCDGGRMTLIGMDLRPRSALGWVGLYFAVIGQQVLLVKDSIDEKEALWPYVVRAGLSQLPYAPMRQTSMEKPPHKDAPRI